jgi:putative ABC transport system substrate-binding protein
MRRGSHCAAALALFCAWVAPSVAGGQGMTKTAHVGVLANRPSQATEGLRRGLNELGYVEGANLRMEYRWAQGRYELYPALAKELVELKVDAIVTSTTPAVLAAQQETRTIPIVMASAGDPVASGVVASLAYPGGNVTGLSSFTIDVEGKRLELLKELLPTLSRVGVLWNRSNQSNLLAVERAQRVADELGVRLEPTGIARPSDLDEAFRALTDLRPDAVLVIGDPILLEEAPRIVEFMARSRLPASYLYRDFAEAGGLMTYATSFHDLGRRAAAYVDKILKGAKAAELPVERPTKFELILNLRTAMALGLAIPPALLARADEVIE